MSVSWTEDGEILINDLLGRCLEGALSGVASGDKLSGTVFGNWVLNWKVLEL